MILVKITHLTANIPFKQCNINFLLKSHNPNHPQNQISQVKLIPKTISANINQCLQVKSQLLTSHEHDLMLCVLAVSNSNQNNNNVVHIGYILIDPLQPVQNKTMPLKGLPDQTGYIEYSIIHSNNKNARKRSNQYKQSQKNQTNKQKPQAYKDVISKKVSVQNYQSVQQESLPLQINETKKNKNKIVNLTNVKILPQKSSSQIFQSNNKIGNTLQYQGSQKRGFDKMKESSQSQQIIQLRSQLRQMRQQTQQYKREIQNKMDTYQRTIDMLRHEILNQSYITVLRNNEIFQLKNKHKIQRLIGKASVNANFKNQQK